MTAFDPKRTFGSQASNSQMHLLSDRYHAIQGTAPCANIVGGAAQLSPLLLENSTWIGANTYLARSPRASLVLAAQAVRHRRQKSGRRLIGRVSSPSGASTNGSRRGASRAHAWPCCSSTAALAKRNRLFCLYSRLGRNATSWRNGISAARAEPSTRAGFLR